MSSLPHEPKGPPSLYVVATPIGNLDDMTLRARRTLEAVDVIAAEDTRTSLVLLNHLGIKGKRLVSYHDHNEESRAAALVREMSDGGLSVALITDAGTPCISDPGYRLVRAAKEAGIPVHPIPGACALTALASAAGLATDRLLFVGFLPPKAVAMEEEVRSWAQTRASIIFYESTRRLAKTLAIVRGVHPHARVSIGRELTKLFEEIRTLPISEALAWLATHPTLKGEATVMVEIPPVAPMTAEQGALAAEALIGAARIEFGHGATLKDLLQKYRESGFKRPELYRLLLGAREPG